MKRLAVLATPFWIGGTLLAFSGVVLARMVSPGLTDGWRGAVLLAGEFVGLGGLLLIALGLRRRLRDGGTQA